MVVIKEIIGFENWSKEKAKYKKKDNVFVYYTSSRLPDGKFWCPVCAQSYDLVMKAAEKGPKDLMFAVVHVGEEAEWRDPNNPFKKAGMLTAIPLLVQLNGPKKLEGEQCHKEELLKMLFHEE